MFYVFSGLSLAAAAAAIYMAGLVFFKNPQALLNRLFALLCLFIAWWAFAGFQGRIATTESQAYFWLHLQLWAFPTIIFPRFAIIFTRQTRLGKLWLTLPLYGLASLIVILEATTDLITADPVRGPWGWGYRYADNLFHLLPLVTVGSLALIALVLVFRYWRQQREALLRRQAALALMGFSLPVAVGVCFSVALPSLGIYLPDPTTIAFGLWGTTFIGFAVWRYQLFRDDEQLPQDVISPAPDLLVMLNGAGQITGVNDALVELLGYQEQELRLDGIATIFSEDVGLWRSLLLESQDEVRELKTRIRKKNGSLLDVSVSTKKTQNAGGEKEIVCIISDLTARLKVAQALEKSEQRYRRLLETSPDAIAVTDLKSNIIMANQQAASFYGVATPAEMVGKNFLKILAPGQRIKGISFIRETIVRGMNKDVEFIFSKNDGSRFPGEMSSAVLKNPAGRPTGFISSVADLTERHRAAQEIEERTADLSLINSLNEAANQGNSLDEVYTLLTKKLRDGFHSSVAALYLPLDGGRKLRLHGDPVSAAKKKKIEALSHLRIADYMTVELQPGSLHLQFLQKGAPSIINDPVMVADMVAEFMSGTLRRLVPPVMKIVGVKASLCVPFVIRGEPIGMMILSRARFFSERELERAAAISEQITTLLHRQLMEKRLQESEAFHRSLIETSPDDIAMIDMEGQVIMANQSAATLHGFESPEELVGRNVIEMIAPADRDRALGALGRLSRTGGMASLEVNVLRKDGGVSPAEINASLLRNERGEPVGFVKVVRDITERRKAESQIASQQQALKGRNAELAALYSISSAVSNSVDLEDLLEQGLEAVSMVGLTSMLRSTIFIRDDGGLRLAAQVGDGGHSSPCQNGLKLGECLCGHVAQTGEMLVSKNSESDPHHIFHDARLGPHGHVVVPLKVKDEAIGVLCLYFPVGVRPPERTLNLLKTVGSQLGLAIDNVRLYEQARMLSLHDPLTGLANRRLLDIQMEDNLSRARRLEHSFTLIMIDLDHFKRFNDTYGHLAGDVLLKDIAQIIRGCIRAMDFACRYGGEEFMVILPETGVTAAVQTAERIRQKVAKFKFYQPGVQPAHITVSLGLADYDQGVLKGEELIARADASLYAAKQGGRNRVECWDSVKGEVG